jgi:hypothetical protein
VTPPDAAGWPALEPLEESPAHEEDKLPVDVVSALGAGGGVGAGVLVVVVVPVVVGSELGDGVVVVVVSPVVDVSGLCESVVVVGAGVVVGVVVVVVSLQPALPAAATVGVVDCASTVASVCVWVRPGGTTGLGFVLPVLATICLAGGLVTVLCAVVAAGLVGLVGLAALAGLAVWAGLTTAVWCTTACTGAVLAGVVGTDVWVGTDAT